MTNEVSRELLDMWDIAPEESGERTADEAQVGFDELISNIGDELAVANPPALKEVEVEEIDEAETEPEPEPEKKKEITKDNTEEPVEAEEKKENSFINEMAENIIKEEVSKTDEPEIDMDEIFSASNKGNEEKTDDIEGDAEASAENTGPQESQSADLPDDPQDSNNESDEDEGEAEQQGSEKMKTDIESLLGNSDITWLLDSPSDKYDNFYGEKRRFLPSLLPGGLVPVSQYEDMLRHASVDIDIGTFDAETAHSKMVECQQWRSRLQEVYIHVNSQYRRWDRAVELFRGVLARIEYEKPAARQEGVIYQHMRDMEMYLKQLEGLHETLNYVMKNIESAWETMSRRVTIALPSHNREAERYSPPRKTASPVEIADPIEEETEESDVDYGGFDSIGDEKPTVKKDSSPEPETMEF